MDYPLTDTAPTHHGLEPFLTVEELAEHLGVPVATVYDWRCRGVGPVAYRLGKHLRFNVPDVERWLGTRRDRAQR